MTTAAIYARSSKDRADIAMDTQVHELEQLAASRGLTVVARFDDAVESGATDDRPAFAQLVAAIKDPRRGWSVLLVYDTSRIARRRHIAQAFKHIARKSGVQITYAKLPADMDPVSEMVLDAVFEAMDEAHSLMSRDKAMAGMRENVRRGWRAGGRAPLGYRLERTATGASRDGKPVTKSKLVPNTDAPKVAAYLQRRAAGEPRPAILRELGVAWKPNSLVDVERRALVYAGHLVWHQHDAQGRIRPRTAWQVTRDAHEALITDAEAEAILGRLMDSRHGAKVSEGKRAASAALLTGIMWAPDGRAWRSAGPYYRLEGKPGRKVRRETIDQSVAARVIEDMSNEGFLAGLIQASREQVADDGPRERLRREAARLRRERDRAARLAIENEDAGSWAALVGERSRQIAGLERELAALEDDDTVTRQLRALTPAALRDLLSTTDPGGLILSLVDRIVIGPDLSGRIEYRQAGAVNMASPRRRHGYGPAISLPFCIAA